jgi:molybdopterin-guanine dinucleotide biosynthesis protein A
MGGAPKGLLAAPKTGEPLVTRLARLATSRGYRVVLVGDNPAYATLCLPVIHDQPSGVGPLGGLSALVHAAELEGAAAVALACDLPFVTEDLLGRLERHAADAAIVAPYLDERWQPLFARYDPAQTRPRIDALLERGERALQRLFASVGDGVSALPLSPGEAALLRDWDRPEDVI